MPLISVVMPVYNGQEYLEAAVRSVLHQTMRDLELIVVDDGSSDRSVEILERLADEDRRVRVEVSPANQGHRIASNRALDLATGKLIARHDQDDVLMADWLSHAVSFLDENKDIGLLGGAYRHMDNDALGKLRVPPTRHTEIRASLLFRNVFCHPGVVVRSAVRESGELEYREFAGPQDYDLWVRLLGVTRGANLAQQAVLYRRHATTMSGVYESDMPSEVERISNRQLEALLGARAPGTDGLRAMRRLWRAQKLEPGDWAFTDLMGAVFDGLGCDSLVEPSQLDETRRAWARRLLSRSMRTYHRFPLGLARAEPRATATWLFQDLPAGALAAAQRSK